MRLCYKVIAVLAAIAPTAAAQPPDTDIWVADLWLDGTEVRIGMPANATGRPGYDNQPCYLPGGTAFLFSAADSAGATDVYRWDADGSGPVRLTRTPESEYSPTPVDPPGIGFCAVRVEGDGTQRLWHFDADGSSPRLVLSAVDSVGYFAWMDPGTVALFIVGDPHTLRIVDVATQREAIVARDIGRCLQRVPATRDITFARATADDRYEFLVVPMETRAPLDLLPAPEGGQDAAWAGETLLASAPDGIYAARPFEGGGWVRVLDAARSEAGTITRIAVRSDRRAIAFVASP